MVGAGWIVLEATGAVPTRAYSPDMFTDTALVFLIDALTLAAASIGGWAARPEPSSSSGTGKGR